MAFVPGFIDDGSFEPSAFSFLQMAEDSESLAAPGGSVLLANAGATILLGDAVYYSATGVTVNKSATASNYLGTFAGVVLGGGSIVAGNRAITATPSAYGVITAATANQQVLVQTSGVALMVAASAITANTNVGPSATAGRIATATTGGPVFGRALDAAANNGDVIRVLLAGTGSASGGSTAPLVARIDVTPNQASISAGTQQFTATAYNQYGGTFTDTFTWTSTTVAAATVSATGLATKVAAGTTAIVATSVANPNISGFAILTVT